MSPAGFLLSSFIFLLLHIIWACPGGNNERIEPLGPCNTTQPKCPPNAYCYPLQWIGPQQFQWVCCPNTTTTAQPSSTTTVHTTPFPPAPTFPQAPYSHPAPPLFPTKRSRGIPITIPLNDAAKQQVPFGMMNLVQEQIQRYPVLMISMTNCPWCQKAKELLEDFYPGLTYYYFDYDVNPDGNPIANAAMGVSGMRTVPMIYVCQQLIGGFTDLQNLHVAHELQSRLQKCTTF